MLVQRPNSPHDYPLALLLYYALNNAIQRHTIAQIPRHHKFINVKKNSIKKTNKMENQESEDIIQGFEGDKFDSRCSYLSSNGLVCITAAGQSKPINLL